jgi:membrane protein implicated in regulation of membrane protease activity
LFVILVVLALWFSWRRIQSVVNPERNVSEQTDRFMPTGYGRLWSLNQQFVIVTDVTTGYEYLFVHGCGGVRLEKK